MHRGPLTAERVREWLRRHEIEHGELGSKLTASCGVSDLGREDLTEIRLGADKAVSASKKGGRHRASIV
jgi:PleD family two-component response regulator